MEISKGAIVRRPGDKDEPAAGLGVRRHHDLPRKLKLFATGFAESAIAVAQAVQSFRPEMKIQPMCSTKHRRAGRRRRAALGAAQRQPREVVGEAEVPLGTDSGELVAALPEAGMHRDRAHAACLHGARVIA
ncbi:MAG: hypothetical protein LC777_08015, partial [Actinobacteria bacterium]|nr:hypothetical protein [Actinomycetota bacterium]